jgi:hypothetical protein
VWHQPPASISSNTANRSSYNVRLNLTLAALAVTFLTTVKRPSHPRSLPFALHLRRPDRRANGSALALTRGVARGRSRWQALEFPPPTLGDRHHETRGRPHGRVSSSTSRVMAIAKTPSLKASIAKGVPPYCRLRQPFLDPCRGHSTTHPSGVMPLIAAAHTVDQLRGR